MERKVNNSIDRFACVVFCWFVGHSFLRTMVGWRWKSKGAKRSILNLFGWCQAGRFLTPNPQTCLSSFGCDSPPRPLRSCCNEAFDFGASTVGTVVSPWTTNILVVSLDSPNNVFHPSSLGPQRRTAAPKEEKASGGSSVCDH